MFTDSECIHWPYSTYTVYCVMTHLSSDNGGRYAYDQQPSVSRWNMEKLAEALAPYLTSDRVKEGLEQ